MENSSAPYVAQEAVVGFYRSARTGDRRRRAKRLRLEAARADFVPAALLRAYLVALKIWALGYCSTRSLLGRSKTWRGLAAAVILAACAAVLMSLPWQLGALAAASATAGDCLSSFIKRRFGLEPSSMTLGPDHISGPRIGVSRGRFRRLTCRLVLSTLP
jgi:hypothetical protein